MRTAITLLLVSLLCGSWTWEEKASKTVTVTKKVKLPFSGKVMVEMEEDAPLHYIHDQRMYDEGWSELAQPAFWGEVMTLTNDSGILNVGSTRQIITKVKISEWSGLKDARKTAIRDSIRYYNCLDEDEHIYLTSGKSHFYEFERIIPKIDRAIKIFESDTVSPWYAQAILLIESPNAIQKSPVGAYGSFQLMKGVARQMGLKVNKTVDERKDFDKCAAGSAKLIKTVCIPYANKILEKRGIEYNENDFWYRLFVLHVYHAGAYNVAKAVDCLKEDQRGMSLITGLWQVECGSFRNASQNYTQVALASVLQLESLIYEEALDICVAD